MEIQLTQAEKESTYLAGGFAHPELASDIAESMGMELGPLNQKTHPNGELYARFSESVRGKHVFLIQSHVSGPNTNINDAIMEQCLLADAARSSSASEITAVSPYLAYTRQDRKSKGREPIGIRVVIDQLAAAGVSRIVAVDMHSPQAQGIFRGPFDHLTAQPLLTSAMAEEIKDLDREECIVVAPDAGAAKLAEFHRSELGVGLLHLAKMRDPDDSQKLLREKHIPEAEGKVCMIFDDMIDTAGTLVSAAEALKSSGAKAIYAATTHGILSDPALERIKNSPINRVIITDTERTDIAQKELGNKLRVVSTAEMVGKALTEIIKKGSVSQLFHDHNHM